MSRLKLLMLLSILTPVILTDASADEAAWRLLGAVKIEEKGEGLNWEAVKTFPDDLRAASDAFRITGFAVPIVPEPYVQTFLLVADPEDCPFCGSSGYGPSLEVHLKRPIADLTEFDVVTLEDRLELIEDPMTFQAYRLMDAVPMGSQG